jgi:preprotein translocase subunit SecG
VYPTSREFFGGNRHFMEEVSFLQRAAGIHHILFLKNILLLGVLKCMLLV